MKTKRNFLGLMFHHFHDDKRFLKSQGSIEKDQFYKLIKHVGRKNIIDPKEFIDKFLNNKLNKNEICLTFDDGIRSQYEVAFPVMQDLKITGFFFIYSSILKNEINILELTRFFKENFYKKIDHYYEDFNSELKKIKNILRINKILIKNKLNFIETKKKFNFYSIPDIEYRFIRDNLISKSEFEKINLILFKKYKFDYKKKQNHFYMSEKNIKNLLKNFNEIGLHSHSHPTKISNLSYRNQLNEYKTNKILLEKLTKNKIVSMSHPCGKFNSNTIKVLKSLKIKAGFSNAINSKFNFKIKDHNFLIPREDHINLINKI